jgi:PAS domain S-box-containing protein
MIYAYASMKNHVNHVPFTHEHALVQLHLLVDHVPSLLAYWDAKLVCRFANRAFEQWFGRAPSSLIGTRVEDFLGPDLFALNRPHIEAVLRGEEQLFERQIPTSDGVMRSVMVHYVPDITDARVAGFVSQVTELTALRQTEAALHQEHALRNRLEQRAEELDALLRERSEMLELLTDEVRLPLRKASDVLKEAAGQLPASAIDAARGADRAVQRLKRAQAVLSKVLASVEDALADAALLAGSEQLQCAHADIGQLVQDAIDDMPPDAFGRFRVQWLTAHRHAWMDMNLMRLALRNLLSNALKFGIDGAPVAVQITDSAAPTGIAVEVSNSGLAIEESMLPRLFERGVRGNNARNKPGHGLGLYLVRRVMELHGGSVTLVRNSSSGITMRLDLVRSAPVQR